MRNTCPSAGAQESLPSTAGRLDMRDSDACVPLPDDPLRPAGRSRHGWPGPRIAGRRTMTCETPVRPQACRESLSSAIKQPNMRDATPRVPLPDDPSAAQEVPAMDGPGRVSQEDTFDMRNTCPSARRAKMRRRYACMRGATPPQRAPAPPFLPLRACVRKPSRPYTGARRKSSRPVCAARKMRAFARRALTACSPAALTGLAGDAFAARPCALHHHRRRERPFGAPFPRSLYGWRPLWRTPCAPWA